MSHHPHDALFKASLTPEAARALCRAVLPPRLAQALAEAEITRASNEFIERALQDRASDVIYRARISEEETLIYVLFEHQSTVDRLMALRVLRYMVCIWTQWLEDEPGRPERLPPIVPIVVYHGQRPWNAAQSFQDLVDLPPELAGATWLVPSFRYVLDDLTQRSDEEIRARQAPPFALVAWIFFRHVYLEDWGIEVWRRCSDLIAAIAARLPEDMDSLAQLVGYSLFQDLGSREELQAELRRLGPAAEEVAVTYGDQLLEQGRQEGRLEGQRQFLLRILARLGPVTPEIASQVEVASEEELQTWGDRALSAKSPADVLGLS